ncbi:MAG TPA: butyrate kinase [Bacteroidetes bacterium]|nr:butyrate kinase [Bacteroidota bacterium]
MEEIYRILAINPGSTSTKVAVYRNTKSRFIKTIRHSAEELAGFKNITGQFRYRKEMILAELENAGIDVRQLSAVIGRGGLVKPIESGVYEVNEQMKEDLRKGVMGQHASNLGGLIADEIARSVPGARAFIADPVVVDELQDIARLSGHPRFERRSVFHALNHKAIAKAHARSQDRKYEDMNLVVAHLGGGISVGAHRRGRVVDVNQALDGEGPFSPERSGTLPVGELVDFCFSGEATREEIRKMITGKGGLVAYLGTNDAYEVEMRARKGDEKARLVQESMAYQIGKAIASMAAVLHGEVDSIIITGGIAHNTDVVEYLKKMVSFIAPVAVYPGEDEMNALALNAYLVMTGDVKAKEYV